MARWRGVTIITSMALVVDIGPLSMANGDAPIEEDSNADLMMRYDADDADPLLPVGAIKQIRQPETMAPVSTTVLLCW
jgi:hypothetical protein